MDLNEYQRIIVSPERQGALSSVESRLGLGGLGLAGECGEVCDLIKKILHHGVPLDEERRAKLKLELGDVLWYLGFTAHALGLDFSDVAQANLDKLAKRYPAGFSKEAAAARHEAERGVAGDRCEGGNNCGRLGCPECQQ